MSVDAVAVAPHIYKVLLENPRVRVLEVRAQPGAKTDMHTHPSQVAVSINHGRYRFGHPDGHSFDVELQPGQAIYLEPVEHTTEILAPNEAHILLVELK